MALAVTHYPDDSVFLATVDDVQAGVIEYRRRGPDIAILHTIVDPDYEGQGIGSALAVAVLDAARANGWGVLPYCPFIKAYLVKHPAALELVPLEQRATFDLT